MSSNLPTPQAGDAIENFIIRRAGEEDIPAAMALVQRVFTLFVAEGFSKEGIETFRNYIEDIEVVRQRLDNHFILLAYHADILAGMIEMRNYDHISLLFVAPEYQKMGCANLLFGSAVTICRDNRPDFSSVSVNSSPYAVPIYRRMGFKEISEEMEMDGIRFTKMIWNQE